MTLSKMFSLAKTIDKELLLEISEMVLLLIKFGYVEIAEGFGQIYFDLDTRIKTYDYSWEDNLENEFEKILLCK